MKRLAFFVLSMIALAAPHLPAAGSDETGLDVSRTNSPGDYVMEIDGWLIPSEWFLHEFRSTFFQHASSTNIRDAVFGPFRNRMILHAKARAEGVDRDPTLRTAIDEKVKSMRSYMEYQIQMAEIDMVNEELVRRLELKTSPDAITEDQLETFYNAHIRSRPGAPGSLHDVPAHVLESLKVQAAQHIMDERLNELVHAWQTNMVISINEDAVQSVPMPVMKGTPPAGWRPK